MSNFINVSAVPTGKTVAELLAEKGVAVPPAPTTPPARSESPLPAALAPLAEAECFFLPHQEPDAIDRREREWYSTIRPVTALECWLLRQIATQSVAMDRHQAQVLTIREDQRQRALVSWDEDRRLAAIELGDQLASKPERTIARWRQTKQGCDWLIERWMALKGRVSRRGWDADGRNRALDLLGVPRSERDDQDDTPPLADVAAIEAHIHSLEAYRDAVLIDRDQHERAAAAVGQGPPTAALRQSQNQATRAMRFITWGIAAIRGHVTVPRTPQQPQAQPQPQPQPKAPQNPAATAKGFLHQIAEGMKHPLRKSKESQRRPQ